MVAESGDSVLAECGRTADKPVLTIEQRFFLERLRRLATTLRNVKGVVEPDSWQGILLSKAVYSTYRDCVGLGIGDQAVDLLGELADGVNKTTTD